MGKLADNVVAAKLVKMLVTPFDQTDAFKLGIIDKDGNVLRKQSTFTKSEEHDAYNYLTRFVFNMKRIINKIGGENALKSLAAALFLFKEKQAKLKESAELQEDLQNLEDNFNVILDDDNLSLELELVKQVLEEEMVSTEALPKEPGGQTTPAIKQKTRKTYKVLRRQLEQK